MTSLTWDGKLFVPSPCCGLTRHQVLSCFSLVTFFSSEKINFICSICSNWEIVEWAILKIV